MPLTYLVFQDVISEEVAKCRANAQPAILNQREFAALAKKIPNNDILDQEELSVGKQYLPLWTLSVTCVCSRYVSNCGQK